MRNQQVLQLVLRNSHQSLSTQGSPNRNTRKIVIETTDDVVTISGKLSVSSKLAKDASRSSTTCPICAHNIHLKMEDVLILRQFLDHNHEVYPQNVTGICDTQYEKLTECVRLSQANNLLPRPENFQLPYRFSERISMQNVQINFLPHTERELLVRGKFGIDHY